MWTASAAATVEARTVEESTVFTMHTRPHWETIADAVDSALATEPTDIPGVLVRQEALQGVLERLPGGEDNPAASFNSLYRTITGLVDERSTQHGFVDDDYLVELDVQFARRYFAAVRAAALGSGSLPRVWGILFDARPGVSRMASAALGVNAHVNYDLAFALLATLQHLGDGDFPTDDSPQMQDYLAINDIFRQAIPGLEQQFAGDDRYVQTIIKLAGHFGVGVADEAVVVSRGLAWEVAQNELWPVRDEPDELTRRDEELDLLATGIGLLVRSPLADVVLGHGHPGD